MWMLIVWIHILAAMFWIGGMIFFSVILVPSLREMPSPQRTILMSRVGKRFRPAGWLSLGVVFISGLVLLYYHGFPLSFYGPAFQIKLTMFFAMVVLTALHDLILGPRSIRISQASPGISHPLQMAVRWLARFNLLIGIFIVLAAVYVARAF